MSANTQIPLGKFAWLILVVVIAAPTAFFLLVTPKEPDEPPAPPVEKRPLSKLESVGLRDYRDWDGLPEIFAVWADRAQWWKDKTRIAFWHPGAMRYDYFFEVERNLKGYFFREVRPTEDEQKFILELEKAADPHRDFSPQHPLLLFPHLYTTYPQQGIRVPPKTRMPDPGKIEIQMPLKP